VPGRGQAASDMAEPLGEGRKPLRAIAARGRWEPGDLFGAGMIRDPIPPRGVAEFRTRTVLKAVDRKDLWVRVPRPPHGPLRRAFVFQRCHSLPAEQLSGKPFSQGPGPCWPVISDRCWSGDRPRKPARGGESANLLPTRGDRSVTEQVSSGSHQLGSKSRAPWKARDPA
jgi:hypothetical protein